MNRQLQHITRRCTLFLTFLLACSSFTAIAQNRKYIDTTPLSTRKQAISFLEKQADLRPSNFWPNVNPVIFIQNLRNNLEDPLSIHEGKSTNFCAYAALSYMPLHDDPLGFITFMLKIYKEGKAIYGREYFEPSKEVKLAAGTLTFKGELDIRPADQLWFMLLADHFKGYLNFFDKQYNPGDENRLWASVNFAKYNRMVRNLFNYEVTSVGSDLFKPGIRDIYEYLADKLATGTVTLFVNNVNLYKRNQTRLKFGVPTHFVILLAVEEVDNQIAITYWDYGGRTRMLITERFFKKILFGISHAIKKTKHAP